MNPTKRPTTNSSSASSGREAAKCYVSDEGFAEAFDGELEVLYRAQLAHLERLATRIGHRRAPFDIKRADSEIPENETRVAVDSVHETIRKSASRGLSRGEIAAHFDVDSKDVRLTRALRILKQNGQIDQRGVRRSARYYVKVSPSKK